MKPNRFHVPLLAQALLLVIAMLLVSPVAGANGAVTASLSAGSENLTVGDPVGLVLTVRHPAGYEVLPPRLEQTWGDFAVNAVSPASTAANSDGTETTTVQIDARLFKPGAFVTLPLDVTLTDGSGNLTEVTAAGVPVTVASVLEEGDTELRDIKPQANLPLPAVWPWVLASVLAVLALAGALFWIIMRRTSRVVDNRLPHERALDELSAIETMRLAQQRRFKEHYTLVSGCVRSYIERAFDIPALELTTGEIEPDLAKANFSLEVQEALVAFLEDSDIVKFTTLTPDEAGAGRLLLQARTIVQATAPKPADTPKKGCGQVSPVRPEQALEAAI